MKSLWAQFILTLMFIDLTEWEWGVFVVPPVLPELIVRKSSNVTQVQLMWQMLDMPFAKPHVQSCTWFIVFFLFIFLFLSFCFHLLLFSGCLQAATVQFLYDWAAVDCFAISLCCSFSLLLSWSPWDSESPLRLSTFLMHIAFKASLDGHDFQSWLAALVPT